MDPRDVIYTKTRLRTPLRDQSSRRPPHPEWNQVVFSDESRFKLSSDDNRVRVWRPRVECLNPAFALQRHTAPTDGVMVWGAIAYNIRSPFGVDWKYTQIYNPQKDA
ncbi:transposable element Tcb1 transposase [Trichonephila clavipes]|nr:transposable element Tcb1 transposase [Trichonephila clavipes]